MRKRRNLTLYGKINIVKTLGLSKLIYNASVLVIPEQLIHKINSIICNFIWDGKPVKIKKLTIIGEKYEGGLRTTDFNIINKALKVAWIQRINSENGASWKINPELALKKHGGLTFLINCNYDVNTLQTNHLPPFYLEILKQWQIRKLEKIVQKLKLKKTIWNNQKILINGKPLFYKSWFDKNIIRVGDLLQKDGKFLSFENFCTKFKIDVPFALHFGLINAIQVVWKLAIKRSPSRLSECEKTIENTCTKKAYSILLKINFVPPTAENKIFRYGFYHS